MKNGAILNYLTESYSIYLNGEFHFEYGPAIVDLIGRQYWYYHGQQIDCKNLNEFRKIIKMKAFYNARR